MSNQVRGPRGAWVHSVKWLCSMSDGRTVEGYIGVGDETGTAWQKLQQLLAESNGLLFVTQLRLQYGNLTIHAIPHAGAHTCHASFSLNPASPQKSYQEQAIMGSKIGDTWYILRLSQDGQVWQEIKTGVDAASVPGG